MTQVGKDTQIHNKVHKIHLLPSSVFRVRTTDRLNHREKTQLIMYVIMCCQKRYRENFRCLPCRPWCGDVDPTEALALLPAAGGDSDILLSRREASAVPDPVVSASAAAVPHPAQVAPSNVVSKRCEGGGKKRKGNVRRIVPKRTQLQRRDPRQRLARRDLQIGVGVYKAKAGKFESDPGFGGFGGVAECVTLVRLILPNKPLPHICR